MTAFSDLLLPNIGWNPYEEIVKLFYLFSMGILPPTTLKGLILGGGGVELLGLVWTSWPIIISPYTLLA